MQKPRETGAIIFAVDGRVDRRDIRVWCARFREFLESHPGDAVICDTGGLYPVDVATVDLLARLQLTARQCGRRFRIRHASEELQGLLRLLGLSEVVPIETASTLQARRQAEEREEPRGVQEKADPGDPTV